MICSIIDMNFNKSSNIVLITIKQRKRTQIKENSVNQLNPTDVQVLLCPFRVLLVREVVQHKLLTELVKCTINDTLLYNERRLIKYTLMVLVK